MVSFVVNCLDAFISAYKPSLRESKSHKMARDRSICVINSVGMICNLDVVYHSGKERGCECATAL